MQLPSKPISNLPSDAKDFLDLYVSLGERAENFLPKHVIDNLQAFAELCCDEPNDPVRQRTEIEKGILELKALIPGYVDVFLLLFPHEDSKAFQYSSQKQRFNARLMS